MGSCAFVVRVAPGNHGRMTFGHVSAGMCGTLSIQEGFVQDVERPGNRPSACVATHGLGTTLGISGMKITKNVDSPQQR